MNSPASMNIVVSIAASCQPNPLRLSGGPVSLSFQLSADSQSAGWVFDAPDSGSNDTPDSGSKEDQYSGITVLGDCRTEFTGLQTASNNHGVVQVVFTDLDNDTGRYTYLVKLVNKITGLKVTIDPSIRNQTVHTKMRPISQRR